MKKCPDRSVDLGGVKVVDGTAGVGVGVATAAALRLAGR